MSSLTPAKRAEVTKQIVAMSQTGLRVICLGTMDLAAGAAVPTKLPSANLTLVCLLGIKDPLRKEVPDAVATCQRAGIMVRMITGDAVDTAAHIARECGILTSDGQVLAGPEFRQLTDKQLDVVLPRLQVIARASPEDKFKLVKELKARGEVVAATGDGTNDAPQLRASDIGLSMGLCGTEAAKEASDIVIMDDNFASIVKAVLWGRSVTNNIRKFLQYAAGLWGADFRGASACLLLLGMDHVRAYPYPCLEYQAAFTAPIPSFPSLQVPADGQLLCPLGGRRRRHRLGLLPRPLRHAAERARAALGQVCWRGDGAPVGPMFASPTKKPHRGRAWRPSTPSCGHGLPLSRFSSLF